MEKLVVKTAVKTVLIVLAILIVAFAVFNFAFPQHMASLSESMGNYSLAIKYADLRYSYTSDVDDLARCFDDAVLLKSTNTARNDLVVKYGNKLIDNEGFEKLCRERDRQYSGLNLAYKNRVYSEIVISKYIKGTTEPPVEGKDLVSEAYRLAAESCLVVSGGQIESCTFEYGNALMRLSLYIAAQNDVEACERMLNLLENSEPLNNYGFDPTLVVDDEQQSFKQTKDKLHTIIAQNQTA